MNPMVLSAESGKPTLADVLPNCVSALRGETGSMGLPPVDQAVVLLVDGLGAVNLKPNTAYARRMVTTWGKRDLAFSFPSTTASAIATLTTGERAGVHGMLGYTVLDRSSGTVRNQLSGWGDGMDPATWQPCPTIFEQLAERPDALPSFVVGVPAYAESGLTQACLRGAEYVAASSIMERIEATLELLAREPRCLIYCYVAELDQAGHRYGAESSEWLAALEELDQAVGVLTQYLPSRAGLIITADHGMVDVPHTRHIDMEYASPLLEGVVHIGGEPRLRHLYLEDASATATERLLERWREHDGHRALIVSREDAMSAGWFGATVTEAARSRIGDILIATQKLVGYYPEDVTGHGRMIVGQHGSIAPEECIVPVIRHGAFARN
ncbi:alkaline phosphatase family protein [Pseudoclavibacter albus]|uniref:alkaline phosphatase family protein n=1 Tax=Pseudoclavibacter albus TaxID=272241 RepID=UPI001F1571F1|nr:nucleotide pyrophosphatase/phosphodiesterase family protein [Pseudoclavibacter alba]